MMEASFGMSTSLNTTVNGKLINVIIDRVDSSKIKP